LAEQRRDGSMRADQKSKKWEEERSGKGDNS
jgi:hypothetical protein